MGKVGTYNYQIQVEKPGSGSMLILGAMKYKEALEMLFAEAKRLDSSVGYIWPQTKQAVRKINNLGLACREINYLKINIEVNTPEKKRYITSGETIF